MKKLHVTIKLRNNLLYQRRKALGLSQRQLCKRLSLCVTEYNVLENLKRYPWNGQRYKQGKKFRWAPIAKKLARFYHVKPEELFPYVFKFILKPLVVYELDAVDSNVLANCVSQFSRENSEMGIDELLMSEGYREALRQALAELPSLNRKLITGYWGLDGQPVSAGMLGQNRGVSQQAISHRIRCTFDQLRRKVLTRVANIPRVERRQENGQEGKEKDSGAR